MLSPRLLLVVTLVAGALSSGGPAADARPAIRFGDPVVAKGGFYEPSVAVDRKGRIFVTDVVGDTIAVSTNGGADFSQLAGPPVPFGGIDSPGYGRLPLAYDPLGGSDAIVQVDPSGRLVFSNLVNTGIQVAVSSTAARTWDSNVFIPGMGPEVDRQWVGFGPKGTVYVMWRGSEGPTFWSATSTDGGRTFGTPEPFLAGVARPDIWLAGPPVVDSSGRVFVPLILGVPHGGIVPQSVAVAVSRRGMAVGAFTVHRVMDGTANWFPIAAVDSAGHVAVAWQGDEAGVALARVAYSTDHGETWKLRRPQVVETTTSPWITLRGGRIDLLDFEIGPGPTGRLVLTRGRLGRSAQQTATVWLTADTDPHTDYAHFALLRDGRVVTVWASAGKVFASVETRPH